MNSGQNATLAPPEGRTTAVVPMHGRIVVNGTRPAGESRLVLFDRSGGEFTITAETEATVLVLSGEPIAEPVIGCGPFVMNSEHEIAQSIRDFQAGRFGRLHGPP